MTTDMSAGERIVDSARKACGFKFPALGKSAQRAVRSILPSVIATELHPGIWAKLDLEDETQRSTWWRGDRFEHPTPQVLRRLAGQGDGLFFDVGSNYGFFTWYLASLFPHLAIHAFEANPRTFQKFEETRCANALDRVNCYNVGLGDREETLVLHRGLVDSGHSTFANHPGLVAAGEDVVRVVPFDLWRRTMKMELPSSPAWLAKIDVEGFELKVLNGMREALAARAFVGLVVEINPFTLDLTQTATDDIFDLLEEFGYRDTSGLQRGTDGNAFFELAET